MSHLFGSSRKAIGAINGKPVSIRTVATGWNSYTIVILDGKETRFKTRQEALNYLRCMADQKGSKLNE